MNNYENHSLPEGMELDEVHKHSDGESIDEVNRTHAMTSSKGSSEESYTGAQGDAQAYVGMKGDRNGPAREASTDTPKADSGNQFGKK